MQLARRTAIGLKEIRKIINIETKFFETVLSGVASTSGSVTCLNLLAQGTNYNERVGDSIRLQKIEMAGWYYINSATTVNGTRLRILLVRDLFQQGTAPTITEILQASSEVATLNYLNKGRFSVLYDELVNLNQVAGEGSGITRTSIPLRGHTKFIGTSAAAGSMGNGSLYLVFLSNEATNTPTLYFRNNLYYTDD